jgi:IMP dehydrogenase
MWPFDKFPKYTFAASKASKFLGKSQHAFTYDDLLLYPQYSDVLSRKLCNLATNLSSHWQLAIPIISANMDTVTGEEMVSAMTLAGASGILHRYQHHHDVLATIRNLRSRLYPRQASVIPSIGVCSEALEMAKDYYRLGCQTICIDIAHGDSKQIIELTKQVRQFMTVVAGNVATYEGADRLAMAGAEIIKVGVGPGSMCTTRLVTGHGVPQASALIEVVRLKKYYPNLKIIADGGIKNSGDIAKALALGADAVMVGSLFAGCTETPGETINGKKAYRGMASREARQNFDPNLHNNYTPEGVATLKPHIGPVEDVIKGLAGGLRSALSYSGAYTLEEFRQKARLMLVTSSSYHEGTPHGL